MTRTRTRRDLALLAVVGAAALALGGALDAFRLDLAVTLLVYMVVAQAWNILGGFGGLASLGAGAFVGTGAYAMALLLIHTGAPWPVALVCSGAAAGVLALVLAVPLLRMRGAYFAVGTLAAAIVLQSLAVNWQWAGGSSGLTLPLDEVPVGLPLYRAAVLLAVLTFGAALYTRDSRFGLRLRSARDDEHAAAGLGVAVFPHHVAALVGSSILLGMAGTVVSLQNLSMTPGSVFGLLWGLDAILMVVVGGVATVMGPVVGVLVVYYGLTKQLDDHATLALVLQGVALVGIVRFAPAGVWPFVVRGWHAVWDRLPVTRAGAAR